MIRLTAISKQFQSAQGALDVLSSLSYSFKKGSFTSFLGPSGCGKTTLLKIIGALIVPTRGEVLIDGKAAHEALRQHDIGFVFQDPTLLPWRTVRGNINLPREILKDKKDMMSVDEAIALVRLNGFGKEFPHTLSGGMRTRVALARALSFHPAILLLDEPFASLDEITRDMMNFELLRIWQQVDSTVVLVTHNISEAVLLSDAVIVLSNRPAHVKEEFLIPFPYPRTPELRRTREFIDLVENIRELLSGQCRGVS